MEPSCIALGVRKEAKVSLTVVEDLEGSCFPAVKMGETLNFAELGRVLPILVRCRLAWFGGRLLGDALDTSADWL